MFQNDNLALNVSMMKELVVDPRKQGNEHNLVLLSREAVEMDDDFRFPGIISPATYLGPLTLMQGSKKHNNSFTFLGT